MNVVHSQTYYKIYVQHIQHECTMTGEIHNTIMTETGVVCPARLIQLGVMKT